MVFVSYQELDVFQKMKVVGIQSEILHYFGIMQIVGIVLRERVVTKGHHLLRSVASQRLVYPNASIFSCLLEEQTNP